MPDRDFASELFPAEVVSAPIVAAEQIVLKRTATEVKDALRRRHSSTNGAWVCVEEAFDGIANVCGGIDFLAIGVWRSAKASGLPGAGRYESGRYGPPCDNRNVTVGYEVKVSRADFRRELYGYQPGANASRCSRAVPPWPGKAQLAYFMFAVPQGLLHDDEIARREPWGADSPRSGALYVPAGIGLVEINDRGCKVRVDAVRREPQPWTRHEVRRSEGRRSSATVSTFGLRFREGESPS